MITITVNPDGSGQLSGEGGEQRVNAGSVFQAREELLRLVASIAAKKGSSVTVAAVDENGTQYISVDAFGAVTLLDETLVVQEYNELFASDLTVAGDVEPPALQPEEGASTSENSLVSEIGGSVDSVAYSRHSPFVAELEGHSPLDSRVLNVDEGEGGPEFLHNDGAYEMDLLPPRIYPKRTRVAQSASSPYRVLSPQSVSPDGDERLNEDPGRLSHTSVLSESTSKSTPSSIIDYSSLLGVDGHKNNDSDSDPGAVGADSEGDPSDVGEGVPGSVFRMDLSVFGLPAMGKNAVGHDDAQSSFPDAFMAYGDVETPSSSLSGRGAELSGFVRDEDLAWGPEWIEQQIQEGLLGYHDMPPLGVGRVVPEEYFERFGGVFPESVLYIWRRFGFDGFGQGRSWITDPVEWAPVVDAWLEGVELPFPPQRWHCLTRTALGRMLLWGEISGPAVTVDVIDGTIRPNSNEAENMTDPVVRERSGCIEFTSPLGDLYDDEVTGRPLAVEGIERLGVPGADEVLGFVPPLSFGGQIRADRLSVQKAVPYLVGLAQSTPRYLGVDLMAAWGGAATQFLIDQGAIPNSINTDTSSGASTPNTPGDPEDLGSPGGHGGSTGLGDQGGSVGFVRGEDLEWGPEWIEQQIQEELLDYEGMPPLGVGRVVPEEYFERFGGVFPESVLYIWRRFGFDGFGQGRSWITDPVEWAPVVDAWLEGIELPFPPQRWHCVARTTLGYMLLWGEISGPALHVDVISGEICPDSLASRDMADSVPRERMGCNIFTSPLMDYGGDEVTGRPLVVEGIERLGVPGADEVFGFVPPLNSGDQVSADRLSVQKAVPYLVGLAQSTPRCLGVDFITFWAGAATQFFADQETMPNSTDASGDLRGQDGLNGPGGQGDSVGFVRDEDLEWGPEWIEERIREDMFESVDPMPPLGVGRVVPEEYFERFGGVFPESVLYIWRRFGFDGFGQGRSWITDPVEWAPVVNAWLEGIELPFPPQRWHCLTRTALGRMLLWGEISGPALDIDVIDGEISPNANEAENMTDPVVRERSGCAVFVMPLADVYDDEVSGRSLVVEGIERLGVPGADEVLGFVPPLSFGGQIRADRLSVQKAVPYLVGLAQSTPRYLGVDLMAAWGGAATQFLIDQGAIPNSTNTPGDPRSPGDPGDQGGSAGPGGQGGPGAPGTSELDTLGDSGGPGGSAGPGGLGGGL